MDSDKQSTRRGFFRGAFAGLGVRAADAVQRKLEDIGVAVRDNETPPVSPDQRMVVRPPSTSRNATQPLLYGRDFFRPPGAFHETDFLELCSRCGQCVQACPEHCIMPAQKTPETKIHTAPPPPDTPIMQPNLIPCTLCGKCMDVCPTGALMPVPPSSVRIGLVAIKARHCVAFGEQHCTRCRDVCPVTPNAITYPAGIEGSSPEVAADRCTGCGLCVPACPTTPKAVEVYPLLAGVLKDDDV